MAEPASSQEQNARESNVTTVSKTPIQKQAIIMRIFLDAVRIH